MPAGRGMRPAVLPWFPLRGRKGPPLVSPSGTEGALLPEIRHKRSPLLYQINRKKAHGVVNGVVNRVR